ncbi:SAM-dependent methyltransferase [Endozoicomonas sp. SM1973]|uniref:S-adenosyl-L-methionine-dependent methyltransferase n=1 Tax=Spartinivicinus marinus TaxID=2994442 RepID=A0A853IPI0_9GAMM|nr:SAM-dependent methyltransferase [Spartinivicinus marinus]MCX4030115.1 SAM-dependent methyltransferase [Spartinivicinus marinus]NYZ69806.1 SAM-dependent methyltransferase [Spartinivicinus marinus]
MGSIERTALWVAGMRAVESEGENPLFHDPFAQLLVDDDSFIDELRSTATNEKVMPPAIQVRTRWLDDEITLAAKNGMFQVVSLAAGMDARVYRLELPRNTRYFEVDYENVLDHKNTKLEHVVSKCEYIPLAMNLELDWPAELKKIGFDTEIPTVWVIEGLLCYLKEEYVKLLFSRVSELSAKGSICLFDVIGLSMLNSPNAKVLHDMAQQFGTDEPERIVEPLGWDVDVCTIAAMGHKLNRWPFPLAPRGIPGVPQSFLVKAVKT